MQNHNNFRKYSRHKIVNTFIVKYQGVGVCKVIDISEGGVAFGCTTDRKIPDTLTVDIIDDSGLHILDYPIQVVWAEKNIDLKTPIIYKVIVGARFIGDLSSQQKSCLEQIINAPN